MSKDKAPVADEDVVEVAEQEDRGDDFTPKEELTELPVEDSHDEDEVQGEEELPPEEENDEKEHDQDKGDEKSTQGVPHKRVNQISREKTITSNIADGIVEGTVDPQFVRDMGGASAVAKAIAKGELQIDDLAPTAKPKAKEGDPESEKTADQLWDEYHEAVEEMDSEKSRQLLKAARAKEREESRSEMAKEFEKHDRQKAAQRDFESADSIFREAVEKNPTLADQESDDYQDFSALYSGYLNSGSSYVDAVNKALRRIAPARQEEEHDDSAAEATRARRKKEAMEKAAKTQQQQPESLANAAGLKSRKVDVGKMSDDEFKSMSPAEKRRARGDDL